MKAVTLCTIKASTDQVRAFWLFACDSFLLLSSYVSATTSLVTSAITDVSDQALAVGERCDHIFQNSPQNQHQMHPSYKKLIFTLRKCYSLLIFILRSVCTPTSSKCFKCPIIYVAIVIALRSCIRTIHHSSLAANCVHVCTANMIHLISLLL